MKATDNNSIRQGFSAIGDILVRDAEIITGKWRENERRAQSNARKAQRDELKNLIPGYLRALGSGLAETGMDNAEQHRRARDFAVQLQSDRKLNDVIADYQILNVTILEHLCEILPRSLTMEELQVIGSDIDEAIMMAVDAFINQSQLEMRDVKKKYQEQLKHNTRSADTRISRLRITTVNLIKSKECERRRIADILRDDLLQLMAVCRLRAEGLRASIDEDSLAGELETIIKILRKSLAVAKKLTRELSTTTETQHNGKRNVSSHCGNSCGK